MTTAVEKKKAFDPFMLMDQMDDKAILAELEGRILDTWAYHFEQGGKEVWGLSKVGVDQACREMAKKGEVIREDELSCVVDPTDKDFILCKAWVSRVLINPEGKEIVLDKIFGTKRQSRFIKNNPDPFWYEKGTMKALRNARLRLIPEEVKSKVIGYAKQDKTKSKKVESNGPPAPPPPKQKAVAGPADPAMKAKLQSLVAQVVELTGDDPGNILVEASRFTAKDKSVQESRGLDPILEHAKWTDFTLQNLEKKIKEVMGEKK